jgi:hypothetical protein
MYFLKSLKKSKQKNTSKDSILHQKEIKIMINLISLPKSANLIYQWIPQICHLLEKVIRHQNKFLLLPQRGQFLVRRIELKQHLTLRRLCQIHKMKICTSKPLLVIQISRLIISISNKGLIQKNSHKEGEEKVLLITICKISLKNDSNIINEKFDVYLY